MDGQEERTIQTLEYMLREFFIDFKYNWDDHLQLIEFPYNNNCHSSISMAQFESLYGRRCSPPIGWFEVDDFAFIYPKLVYKAFKKFWLIRYRSKMAQSQQKSYADNRRRDLEFELGDWVYLNISPIKGNEV